MVCRLDARSTEKLEKGVQHLLSCLFQARTFLDGKTILFVTSSVIIYRQVWPDRAMYILRTDRGSIAHVTLTVTDDAIETRSTLAVHADVSV